MSMPFSIIECDICSKRWFTCDFWGMHSYILSNDCEVSVDREIAWCNTCHDFAWMEKIPDHHALQEKLAEAHQDLVEVQKPKEYVFLWFFKKQVWPKEKDYRHYQKWLKEAKAAIEWRNIRKSPPKCLTCGSLDIYEANLWGDNEENAIRHPDCGGQFSIEESEAQVSRRLRQRFYDAESNFLYDKEDHL